jgi:hypothetical protein
MDSVTDTVDLSATLELRPNTGHSYGRSLNKRAGRSFGSVATRKRSAAGSSSGPFRSGTAAAPSSLYQSRFNRTSAGGDREPPHKSHQPRPPGSSPVPSPAAVLPPEQAWAAEEEAAWAQEQLSDKDQRRYEHEQSQMELMQFIEQLRTVGRAPR